MKTWKDIGGYEGLYKVSDTGLVYSCPRAVNVGRNGGVRHDKGGLMTQHRFGRTNHLRVWLSKEGKKRPFFVHRLVAAAFIDNPQNKPCVNHKDNNPLNNLVDNLEWVTVAENNKHRLEFAPRAIGNQKGSFNSQAKITEKTVLHIRERYKQVCNGAQVAREFNLQPRHVNNIVNRKLWKHI